MKVILTGEYATLGSIGDIVTVASGYARNYLLPKGIAVQATKGNLKQYESMADAIAKKRSAVKADAEALAVKIGALDIGFIRKSGDEGKLFGSVTTMDIAAALKGEGYDIDKRYILLDDHLKALGTVTVPVKLHSEVVAKLTVRVESEEQIESAAAAAEAAAVEPAEETEAESGTESETVSEVAEEAAAE